ncbi:MAG: orotate phosphoribosyltransferase [Bacteroidetes bacterium]|jgi:orotate phosphoribosyltransferase|nr:orotate phosphoribosyltransferase [Bacteroidota bacterium]
MKNYKLQVARLLLQSKAIKLNTATPFTWASGLKSPIYCDNRKTLSYPEIRDVIKEAFVSNLQEMYPNAELIAGVATGAIAQGALVADALNLPFAYVRSSAKSHGLTNLIEGDVQPGKKVVVIEDLISTGGSSLKAVEALRNTAAEVLGMGAIFTYGFKSAQDSFEKANCKLFTITDYNNLLHEALAINYINQNELTQLEAWRKAPELWHST